MELFEITLIALSLSLDCFAVSISIGTTMNVIKLRHIIIPAFFFGSFQGIMPVIGYYAGKSFLNHILAYDHWIAFSILSVIGANMIHNSYKIKEKEMENNYLEFKKIIPLAIATSIDALCLGITLIIFKTPLVFSTTIIAAVSFFMTIIGVLSGYKGRNIFDKSSMEITGGVILISIGLKILLTHIIND